MNYAVIRINKAQYKVTEGEEILVDKLPEDDKLEAEVLLVRTDSETKVGDPVVAGAKVTLKRLTEEKGVKIHVFKYKSKSRYRKKIGSRAKFTKLLVEKIK